jgi:hypothetical protein
MNTNSNHSLIGHILLTIGILGDISKNTYLASICLTVSLVFFARQLFQNYTHRAVSKPTAKQLEEETYLPIQTVSFNKEGETL